jgi:hypothetical protein
MTSLRRQAFGALAVALLAIPLVSVVFLAGCRKGSETEVETNLSPNTRLTSAPGPFSQANYRVHLFWEGSDPDGYIVAYYFAWDDTLPGPGAANSAWVWTTKTDSLFKAVIDTVGETRRHTFYVRSVDNEGMLDPSPARVRFDAWTQTPVVDSLYRLDGPEDPASPNYNPGYKDTVLMGTPCEFVWIGWDPDGLGAPVQFSYRLDSAPFPAFSEETYAMLTDITSRTHFFYVKAQDETGAESFPVNYKFVMNYDPDSHILTPPEPTGTLTWPDRTEITFSWTAHDKEELEGVPGDSGVIEIWIELDTGFQRRFEFAPEDTVYEGSWYFTSATFPASEHYIDSQNTHVGAGGGNKAHTFRIFSKDFRDRFETPSVVPEDREIYEFWYNHPPTTTILYPEWGDTVCSTFTAVWEGEDIDGSVVAYQYVLDPAVNSFREQEETEKLYENVVPDTNGHTFWVAARDNSDCWQKGYTKVEFWIEECE